MNIEPIADHDETLSKWFSTYGLVTAERLIGIFKITLDQEDLKLALKGPYNFYHRLLQIPIQNILSGIVQQQAHDYHVYLQKLFIDYLLSGESGKSETSPGAVTRAELDIEREDVVSLAEEFNKKQIALNNLIAESQICLIDLCKQWNTSLDNAIKEFHNTLMEHGFDLKKSLIRKAINHAIVQCDSTNSDIQNKNYELIEKANEIMGITINENLKESLMNHLSELLAYTINFDSHVVDFPSRVSELSNELRAYRRQFYDKIITVTYLMKLLPEYKIDPVQDAINKEPLFFDRSIGEL